MSDKTKAARRAIADFRRGMLHGRDPSPWQLVSWLETLAAEIERAEDGID